ncbi:MAG: hypothetical protein PHU36_09995 [Syntrophomonadaceae bacterium]|nr:hypothetical protein [Syntrophomonadaceae bacterium]NLV21940.1 hypothetical protein [Syntrophomonadaceae bacterium]
MSELKCEFPEGCRLDLYAKVVKAKYIARQVKVLEDCVCIPLVLTDTVGHYVSAVEDFKVKVVRADEILNFNRVRIIIEFDITLFLILDDGRYHCFTLPGNIYEQTIDLCQFDPPLTIEEFRNEVSESDIILNNWTFDYEIKGCCQDPDSPCFSIMPTVQCPEPVMGTCIHLVVYVDIIDKLSKMHDVIVYGELDPEVE